MITHGIAEPSGALGLQLADGAVWTLLAEDAPAAALVEQLAPIAHLTPQPAPNRWLRLRTETQCGLPWVQRSAQGETLHCQVDALAEGDHLIIQLAHLMFLIAEEAQERGGILLHSALVERAGEGILLAGPSGSGKTTASRRIPSPWRSLSDDNVLVVRDPAGGYWAHPWPTWSRFLFGDKTEGRWETSRAVPLRAVFFLTRAALERAEKIGKGQAAGRLADASQQVFWVFEEDKDEAEVRRLHRQRFHNACDLASAVPSYRLELSLQGRFWDEIERVMML